jgi:predicted amidophosphoribosyltransferase
MICPTCRDEHPPHAQFCPRDGNRLVALHAGAERRAPSGGVCPVCGQGFDPGVTSCPKHDEELVPPAVYAAQSAVVAGLAKICPICGTQYPGDGRFCGRDGAALVPMN